MIFNPGNITQFTHNILSKFINENDIVIDATLGNGHDTFFLADKVGNNGKVYGFDIQEKALKSVKEKLKKHNITNTELVLDSHENIDKYIQKQVSAVVFNLGYLPNSNRKITTTPDKTITAINKSLSLLKQEGIITIVSYIEHDGGKNEYNALKYYLKSLDEKEYTVIEYGIINSKKLPPVLFMIIKR